MRMIELRSGGTVSRTDVLRKAFTPLTQPLTVGPGSISVGIPWVQTNRTSSLSILAAAIWLRLVPATIYLCYAFRARLALVLGPTGTNVFVKLTSFLLVSVGVQIARNGASSY